jgi:hypothetical protein
VTLALAQSLDLVTFVVMVQTVGLEGEGNPLVQRLFHGLGWAGIVLGKVALIVLVGSLVVAATAHVGSRRWAFVGGLPLALAIAVGLIGGITNASVILH